jgi:hypothetical protein
MDTTTTRESAASTAPLYPGLSVEPELKLPPRKASRAVPYFAHRILSIFEA